MAASKMEVENVINTFKNLGYSTTESRSYSSSLMKDYGKLNLQLSDAEIMSTIKTELTALSTAIQNNQTEEFVILPESFDHKYGHWYSLMWIVGRYYLNSNKEHIPEFYMKIISIINKREANRMCSGVISNILGVIAN